MLSTKAKILAKSREIFNAEGFFNTSLRQIAADLGMSQGNLNYHFKTKQDIVEALYFELVEKMNQEMQLMEEQASVLAFLYASAEKSMRIFYQYRFLMRDFYLILKKYDKLRQHYVGLSAMRTEQFLALFQLMKANGLLRDEHFEGEYQRLYERMNILGDNWINSLELLNEEMKEPVAYYHALLFEVIYPYLTEKGQRLYWDIQKQSSS